MRVRTRRRSRPALRPAKHQLTADLMHPPGAISSRSIAGLVLFECAFERVFDSPDQPGAGIAHYEQLLVRV